MNRDPVHCLFLTKMFSETCFSVLFGCTVILFVTSWPPYCFLVHDGQLAKRDRPVHSDRYRFSTFFRKGHGAPISISLFTAQTAHFQAGTSFQQ